MACALNELRTAISSRTVWIVCTVCCMAVYLISGDLAQAVAPITPSGLNTQVNLSSVTHTGTAQYDITGGTRVGGNLFHSFGNFNVPDHNIANFLNDTGLKTSNILGRVTDGNVSNILGTIQTTGFENANLFLMNPAGIVFGPNASLNVGGSVAFTTANYLRLAEINGKAGIFHADSALPSLLTSSPVAAFGFLGPNPAAITVQGSMLTTQPGQSISLVGGNITVEAGKLVTNSGQPAQPNTSPGRINLASVASPGEILGDTLDYAPNIHGQSFGALGTIQVVDKSVIDASGNGGGTVLIRGGQFVLDDSKISANVTGPGTVSNGVELIGGGIDIAVSQDATIQKGASVEINIANGATPGTTYGGVHVKADRIVFVGIPGSALNFDNLQFTSITTNTEGAGNAGNITLQATGNIETTNVISLTSISGSNSDATMPSPKIAQGNAGNVELTSTHGDILMTNGGRATQVTSQIWNSSGNTGRVTASAREGTIVLNGAGLLTASFEGSGQVGPVEITAKDLHMKAGLVSNESLGPSKPGGIMITLSGKVTMEADFSVPAPIPPYSFIFASALGPTGAPAGDISLTAKGLVATQGSLISNGTFVSGPGGHLNIFADTIQLLSGSTVENGSTLAPRFGSFPQGFIPSGAGGTITITGRQASPTTSVLIDGAGSGIFSDSSGTGTAGDIVMKAQLVTIQNKGALSAETSGTVSSAKGGSIIINTTDQVTLTNGGSITASSKGPANAGNIFINAGQQLDMQNGSITTTAEKASGGNIDIRAIDHVRFANSQISASVGADRGNGGNITIDPNTVVLQNAKILANAQQGNGGNITITTPTFLADQFSRIDASSQFGVNGTVTVQSPTSNLSGTVAQLASKTAQTQALLQSRCVALAGGEQSTFIVAGRGALPSEPGGWLSSPLSMDHLRGHDAEHATGPTAKSVGPPGSPAMVVPVRETQALSLRRLTPSGFLVRTFGIDGPTGCRS